MRLTVGDVTVAFTRRFALAFPSSPAIPSQQRRRVFAGCFLAIMLAALDQSIVSTALSSSPANSAA
ncbi:hypothetical protein [Caballeronia sp. LZ016]|uniref:hypothetical protein n=1 Tax=Caballeronia sp. LZ016 TaxID=3038554 RepID=UPI0028611BE9|nr:hypothetical protein [Caballeronia sp. LZ016]MDR5740525.1 hypothetical protein [Caballeronia sp. LZ016]